MSEDNTAVDLLVQLLDYEMRHGEEALRALLAPLLKRRRGRPKSATEEHDALLRRFIAERAAQPGLTPYAYAWGAPGEREASEHGWEPDYLEKLLRSLIKNASWRRFTTPLSETGGRMMDAPLEAVPAGEQLGRWDELTATTDPKSG